MTGTLALVGDLWERLRLYPPAGVLVEVALIAGVLYLVLRFVRGTRVAGALWAFLGILAVGAVLARVLVSARLEYLYDRFLALAAVALIVIFQPELRRALMRIGGASLFRATPSAVEGLVGEIVPACRYLSKNRFGALIVIQGQFGLKGLVEGGTPLNADLTARLLQTIFFPGTALHDLAVVIRRDKIEAAGVQLPLAEPDDMPDPQLGSRHRAAVGLSRESDAMVIVISEEQGTIRLAEGGRLGEPLDLEALESALKIRLGRVASAVDEDADDTVTLRPADEEPTRDMTRTRAGRQRRSDPPAREAPPAPAEGLP